MEGSLRRLSFFGPVVLWVSVRLRPGSWWHLSLPETWEAESCHLPIWPEWGSRQIECRFPTRLPHCCSVRRGWTKGGRVVKIYGNARVKWVLWWQVIVWDGCYWRGFPERTPQGLSLSPDFSFFLTLSLAGRPSSDTPVRLYLANLCCQHCNFLLINVIMKLQCPPSFWIASLAIALALAK